MKKIAIVALLVMGGAAINTASAQSKQEKVISSEKVAPVTMPKSQWIKTKSDSLSYAAGMALTRGLEGYATQQLGVTKEQYPEFVRGVQEAFAHGMTDQYAAYIAGQQVAKQVLQSMLPSMMNDFKGTSTNITKRLVNLGFLDALKKDNSFFSQEAAQEYFEAKLKIAKEEKGMEVRKAGEKFLAENKKKKDVVTLPSGLQYKVLQKGTGAKPTKNDQVVVVYEGRTLDGKVFDATARHGRQSDTFGVGNLIPGWTEALTLMPVGSKWEIYIPQELAYGANGAGEAIAPYSALIFTLELKEIKSANPTPATNKLTIKK